RIAFDTATPRPLAPFYMAFGYANSDYTYTPATQRMYTWLGGYANGCRYMRLHNILTMHGEGDRHFLDGNDYGNPADEHDGFDRVFKLVDGELQADWTLVDRVYDQMRAHDMRPIVETHHVPSCIMAGDAAWRRDNRMQWVPRDFRLWGQCVRMLVEHVTERYGADEVAQWYWEVWNEPDGVRAFRDDPQRFYALYDYMEQAVHAVDSRYRVGGPATMQNEPSYAIFAGFLAHCARGVNHATGTIGTRVDFLSVHAKAGFPTDACPNTEVMFASLERYAGILNEYPQFRDIEFFNDESDIIWAGNCGWRHRGFLAFRSTHYFPGFVCKMIATYCERVIDQLGLNLSVVDSDNCHQQWERSLFSGNRAQLTPLGDYGTADLLPKAAYNAYPLLARLRAQRLPSHCTDAGHGVKFGALATRSENDAAVLCWHFEDGMNEDLPPRTLKLALGELVPPGEYRLIHHRIDAEHSSPYTVWCAQGRPEHPDRDQIAALRQAAELALREPVRKLTVDRQTTHALTLPMHAVSLLQLVPAQSVTLAAPIWRDHATETNCADVPQVFLAWTPATQADFLHYRIQRAEADGHWQTIAERPSLNVACFVDLDVAAGRRYAYRVAAVNAAGEAGATSEDLVVDLPG
ncbi:MAG: GH39 family glycosyl hydrolase, partial [Planctomycetota bacterium]